MATVLAVIVQMALVKIRQTITPGRTGMLVTTLRVVISPLKKYIAHVSEN